MEREILPWAVATSRLSSDSLWKSDDLLEQCCLDILSISTHHRKTTENNRPLSDPYLRSSWCIRNVFVEIISSRRCNAAFNLLIAPIISMLSIKWIWSNFSEISTQMTDILITSMRDQSNPCWRDLQVSKYLYFSSPHLKRKYPLTDTTADCDCSDTQLNQTSPRKKPMASPPDGSRPRTADHASPNKYPREDRSPSLTHQAIDPISEKELNQEKTEPSDQPTSQNILFRLEKILNLCGELRSLAKDVEQHVNAVTPTHEQTTEKELAKSDSEAAIIDIYQELNMQPTNQENAEKNAPPPYTNTNDGDSVHSDSHQSHPLMVRLNIVDHRKLVSCEGL